MDSQIEQLRDRADAIFSDFQEGSRIVDLLHEAIDLDRQVLALCPPGNPARSVALSRLSIRLGTRHAQLGDMADLEEAITLDREALQLRPPGNPVRFVTLNSLALHLSSRHAKLGRVEDLDEALVLGQECLSIHSPGLPGWPTFLNNHADALSTRYKELGRMGDLDEAIALVREALELTPAETPRRLPLLRNLAMHLSFRYKQLGLPTDLELAISLVRESLSLLPAGHSNRPSSLAHLGSLLTVRFENLGAREDLDEAIVLTRGSLNLRPPGHPDRSLSLRVFADQLFRRNELLGDAEDLDEAIAVDSEALGLHPPGHPSRSASLGSLANSLHARYCQRGSMEDLNEAIALHREEIALRSPGLPRRLLSLDNLASCLDSRYRRLGEIDDLEEVMALSQEVLELCPPGNPWRVTILENHATRLLSRYEKLRSVADLDQGIIVSRDALVLLPPGHRDRAMAINVLASLLSKRYYRFKNIQDLNESIAAFREALVVCPVGHVSRWMILINLSASLYSRYDTLKSMADLDEAIILGRDALALLPPGRSTRFTALRDLTERLSARFARLQQAEDKEEIFNLFGKLAQAPGPTSPSDVAATAEWIEAAESFQHPSTLLAYETGLRFLHQYLSPMPFLRQLYAIQHSSLHFGINAFSACLRQGSPIKAIEFLEQGRGVFWRSLSGSRFCVLPEDVAATGTRETNPANRFKEPASQIRTAFDVDDEDGEDGEDGGENKDDEVGKDEEDDIDDGGEVDRGEEEGDDQDGVDVKAEENDEDGEGGKDGEDEENPANVGLEEVVASIHKLRGFSRFLLPSLFADLQQAARDGPVVIVNASEYTCDALVVLLDRDPVHIPLQITQERVRELSEKFHHLARLAKKIDATKELAVALRTLWDVVVSPIVAFLQTVHPSQSRIWWCPTAEFSLLPLHAAGPFRKGELNLADIYISSYTPTLSALIHARRPGPLNSATKKIRFLRVGQGRGDVGDFVSAGLDNIGRRVDSLAIFSRLEGDECTISRVSEELSKSEWVHLACPTLPSLPDQNPFTSGFALADGRLTMQNLVQYKLRDPQFAYLCDDDTAIGDERMLDEEIHFAAAMMFVGFRSVIGARGVVDLGVTGEIEAKFYSHMMDKEGRLDHTCAALALHKTTKELANVPLDQRIAYIHLGA